jgi:fused signal recognition particle receptor
LFDKIRDVLHKFGESITTKTLDETDLSDNLSQLELNLIENEVAVEVANYIVTSLKEKLVGRKVERGQKIDTIIDDALKDILKTLFSTTTSIDLFSIIETKKHAGSSPTTVLFLGINGTGKTTSIAKLSSMLKRKGYIVLMAASDTYRAGAIEQLEIHSQRLGIRILKQRYGSDPAAVARDAKTYALQHGYDVVLIDTAGRMQTSTNLMEELAKIKRVSNPDLTVFVGDALAGNDLIYQAREFLEKVGFDAIILTKTDADVKGGASISVTYVTKRPIMYIGNGQDYGDLIPFDPDWIISKILG